jgi:hypothetical protein
MDSAVRVDYPSLVPVLRVHDYLFIPASDRVGSSSSSQTACSWAQSSKSINSETYVLIDL